jgi:hypothetical protein
VQKPSIAACIYKMALNFSHLPNKKKTVISLFTGFSFKSVLIGECIATGR